MGLVRCARMARRDERSQPRGGPAAPKNGGRAAFVLAAALACLTVLVFAPIRHFEFVSYDDGDFVTANRGIATGLTWESLRWVTANAYYATGGPITWLSHLIDLELFGLDPHGHHLTNLVLHVVNVVGLFTLLRRLTGSLARSGIVAALFAVHPLHVESVAWISQRKDLLSTLFWWLAIWQYHSWAIGKSRARYLATLAWFVCGLLSKPIVIMLPATLLLVDYWPLNRIADGRPIWPQWRALLVEKIPFAVLALIAAWFTLQSQVDRGAVTEWSAPLDVRLYNVALSYAAYLAKTLWPVDLSPFYPYRNAVHGGMLAASLLTFVVCCALAILARRKLPAVTMGWGWYVAALLPVIGFVQIGAHAMADRLTYVPLVGVFIAVVWAAVAAAAQFRLTAMVPLAAGLIAIAACVAVTRQQIWIWQNGENLWRHAVEVDPTNGRALANLAATLAGQGRTSDALSYYREAVRIAPDEPKLLTNYGMALGAAGDRSAAISILRRAVINAPAYAKAHLALADQLAGNGQPDAAFESYRAAISLDPTNGLAHMNYAVTLAESGRFEDAAAQAERAVALEPRRSDWRFSAAMMLAAQGRLDRAILALEELLRIDPSFARARAELARLRSLRQ